jgi:hypothetical protein
MIIHNLVFYAYTLILAFFGSRRVPTFFSWHMFAGLQMMHFNLVFRPHGDDQKLWERLEVYDYLPHTHLSMSISELKVFLVYLGKVRRIEVRGECSHFLGNEVIRLKIERNRIIDV